MGPEARVIIIAPAKFPNIWEAMQKAQNSAKKKPLISSVAQSDMYSPYATQIMAWPKPDMMFVKYKNDTTKLLLVKKLESS